jgi:hypothetical protein
MDYGNLLSRAWRIVWNNKFLLVLGFLAALGSGGGNGGGGPNVNFGGRDFDLPPGTADNIDRFVSQFGPLFAGLICLGVVLGIVLWLVRLVAQAGLISAASRIDAGEKVTLGEAFSAGTSKLGRMVGINVLMYGPFTLLGLIAAGFGIITAGTAVLNEMSVGGPRDIEGLLGGMSIIIFCVICLLCLLLPLLLVVTAIYPFAQRGAVLNDLGVIDSIRHGWNVLRANLGEIILLIVIFVVIGIAFGVVLAIIFIPLAFLALGPTIIGMVSSGNVGVVEVATAAFGFICLGLLAAALNSVVVAFRSTAVTLAYQQFVAKTS